MHVPTEIQLETQCSSRETFLGQEDRIIFNFHPSKLTSKVQHRSILCGAGLM
jgi:hypothetical protein